VDDIIEVVAGRFPSPLPGASYRFRLWRLRWVAFPFCRLSIAVTRFITAVTIPIIATTKPVVLSSTSSPPYV